MFLQKVFFWGIKRRDFFGLPDFRYKELRGISLELNCGNSPKRKEVKSMYSELITTTSKLFENILIPSSINLYRDSSNRIRFIIVGRSSEDFNIRTAELFFNSNNVDFVNIVDWDYSQGEFSISRRSQEPLKELTKIEINLLRNGLVNFISIYRNAKNPALLKIYT